VSQNHKAIQLKKLLPLEEEVGYTSCILLIIFEYLDFRLCQPLQK